MRLGALFGIARTLAVSAALGAGAWLAACGSPTSVEDLRATVITMPNGKTIMAETMREEVDILRGMMFRDALPEGRGMLFVHPMEDKYSYWMYQCKVPLDIIWMNRDRRVVEIAADTPPCPSSSAQECPGYGGHYPARYVLELNAGGAGEYGVRVGQVLSF